MHTRNIRQHPAQARQPLPQLPRFLLRHIRDLLVMLPRSNQQMPGRQRHDIQKGHAQGRAQHHERRGRDQVIVGVGARSGREVRSDVAEGTGCW